MSLYVITVIAHDKVGLLADITRVLAHHGGSIEASAMNIMGEHFTWTFFTETSTDPQTLQSALLDVCPDGVRLTEISNNDETLEEVETSSIVAAELLNENERLHFSVQGADHPGIAAAVTEWVAREGGNIVEFATETRQGTYILNAEIEFTEKIDIASLNIKTKILAKNLDVSIRLHREGPSMGKQRKCQILPKKSQVSLSCRGNQK